MTHRLAALAVSFGLAVAFVQSFASAFGATPERADEAHCSSEEVLEEQRAVDSSLLALDAGRLGRQLQAQNPIRGPLGIDGGTKRERMYFNPENIPESTTPEDGVMFYPMNQPSQVDVILTTTKPPATKPFGMVEVKTTTARPVLKLKPAKKLTKEENKTRAKLAKDCELSDWSGWSVCMQKEDDLSKLYYTTRYRHIVTPQSPGGKRCNETEEYMPCPQESSFRRDINVADVVAGMGQNATSEYGEPEDEEDKEEDAEEDSTDDNTKTKSSSGGSAPMIG